MEFTDCVQTRRSIRRFEDKRVDREVIRQLVCAASCAPSWKNSQTTRYIIIEDKALKEAFAEQVCAVAAFNQKIIRSADCIVMVTTVSSQSGFNADGGFTTAKGTHWESFDAGLAAQTFCLAAHNAGLGTVIMGIFDDVKAAELGNVPEGQKVSALIALGYPAEEPATPKRKTVDELLSFR